MLCDDLGVALAGGWGEAQERGDIWYLELTHVTQQKLTRHCKAIILQFKNKLKNKKIYTLFLIDKRLAAPLKELENIQFHIRKACHINETSR